MPETIALVGSDTLLGRELRDLLSSNSLGADLRLISSAEESTGGLSGTLSEQGGEPAVVIKLDALSLADADALILAGSLESSKIALGLAPGRPVIDLTYAAEDDPRSRLRAPMVEPHDFRVAPDAIQSIAHPAAIALALLLERLSATQKVTAWIAHVFEPASERGIAGVEELQEQAVSLLSFKNMPKKIFDTQLAFSMLAQLGEEAAVRLEDVEGRIERHLASLLENARLTPMPSLRLLQAPVFHGYSFSVWVEFTGDAPDATALEAALGSENLDVHKADVEAPNNVGIAGQDGVAVGSLARDRNNPRAYWFWMVADNLRLPAQNAMMVARELA